MSYARKNAILVTTVWAAILAGLVAIVLGHGVERFTEPDQSSWRLLAALVILPGFLVNAWLGWRSRQGRKSGETDERDEATARRASEVTLIVLGIVVFVTSISLYEAYSDMGSVPTGWLYLIAYGVLALVPLVHGMATLIVDWSGATGG